MKCTIAHYGLKSAVGLAILGFLLLPALSCAGPSAKETLIEKLVSAAEGGSVTSPDGKIALEIPPGALAEDTTVSVKVVPEDEWTDDLKSIEPAGAVYSLEPDGLEFSQPVTITVRLDPDDTAELDLEEGIPAFISLSRSKDGTWEVLANGRTDFQVDTGVVLVTAEMDHFSLWTSTKSRGPLWAMIRPKKVVKYKGETWELTLTIRNQSSIAVLEDVKVSYLTIWPVSTVAISYVKLPQMSPRTSLVASPNQLFKCDEEGVGGYAADVKVKIEPGFAEDFMAALTAAGANVGGDAYQRNLDMLTNFRVRLWGKATCTEEKETATTPPTTTTPEIVITPNTGLTVGDEVTISISGLTPNESFGKAVCINGDCDLHDLMADGDGNFEGTLILDTAGTTTVHVVYNSVTAAEVSFEVAEAPP